MKHLLFFLTFLSFFVCNTVFSQIEIKTAPLMWFTKTGNIGLEYGIKPNLGIEVEYQRIQNGKTIQSTSLSTIANGSLGALKYYFSKNSEAPLSQFYAGGYASYLKGQSKINNVKNTSVSMYSFGATTGYKGLLASNHLVLEAGLNLGKRFLYEGDELAKPSTGITKFFYNWDISLRLLIGYRF
jgi:hypothetical protein